MDNSGEYIRHRVEVLLNQQIRQFGVHFDENQRKALISDICIRYIWNEDSWDSIDEFVTSYLITVDSIVLGAEGVQTVIKWANMLIMLNGK